MSVAGRRRAILIRVREVALRRAECDLAAVSSAVARLDAIDQRLNLITTTLSVPAGLARGNLLRAQADLAARLQGAAREIASARSIEGERLQQAGARYERTRVAVEALQTWHRGACRRETNAMEDRQAAAHPDPARTMR